MTPTTHAPSATTSASGATREMTHPDRGAIELTSVLFALSDPARLELVRMIAADGPQTVAQCHSVDPDTPKSTFSHHLKTLREAGVVRNEPVGRQRRVSLRRDDLDARFPGLLDAVLLDAVLVDAVLVDAETEV